jgi:hypothetical protein
METKTLFLQNNLGETQDHDNSLCFSHLEN